MKIAGLETLAVRAAESRAALIILLHGCGMSAEDLAPFGNSLGVPAGYLFPQGPLAGSPRGRMWWPLEADSRAPLLKHIARDLAEEIPAGLASARAQLEAYIAACQHRFRPQRLIVGGFSQGAMLACDWLLHSRLAPDALLLFSASRLNFPAWESRRDRLRDLPILMSHGQQDQDIAFAAGQQLRDFAVGAQARVTWTEFDGRHEIPLPVWRATRKFLRAIVV